MQDREMDLLEWVTKHTLEEIEEKWGMKVETVAEKGKKMQRLIDEDGLKKSIWEYTDKYGHIEMRITLFNILLERNRVDAEPKWNPITSRPMDDEERVEWSKKRGYDIGDDEALIYTSQLPDDGQEVLVCGRYGRVWIDTFNNDPDYGCGFEENGDMDGIVAWMPLPKPYVEEDGAKMDEVKDG